MKTKKVMPKLKGWKACSKSLPTVSIVFTDGSKLVVQRTVFDAATVAFTELSKENLSDLNRLGSELMFVCQHYDEIVKTCNID